LRRGLILKAALFGGLFMLMVLATIFGPWVWSVDPFAQDIPMRLLAASTAHPLGTDAFGRDTLARVLTGGRWSLLGAALVCVAVTCIGFVTGCLSAFGPRWLDLMLSRIGEAFLAIPGVLSALALTALLRPSFSGLVIALIVSGWAWYARMYRALMQQQAAAGYVEGAHALGASWFQIVVRHVVPNMLGPALVIATINLGGVILNLSTLSFIGMGVQTPTPEWGALVNESRLHFQRQPLLLLAPCFCIALTVFSIHQLGDALHEWVEGGRSS
jgi:ABC-type dipeptide/oligopeptide/nickel transport system permease subunit